MPEITINRPVKVNAVYLQAECGVRYWDDAEVDGSSDDEDNPSMPFADGGVWSPLIEIDTGVIVGWPQGTTASVHYKVCDDGRYTLLDAEKSTLASIDGYVPSIMSPKENGYGDYVIMDIGEDGKIADWTIDLSEFEGEEK